MGVNRSIEVQGPSISNGRDTIVPQTCRVSSLSLYRLLLERDLE